jgi:UDP-N-acetylmuramate--alanine ligase
MDEFARSFHQADRVLVLDIYPASEQPIEGVTAEALVDRMRQYGHRGAEYVGSLANGVLRIVEGLEPGDMVITLGAGSVSTASEMVLEGLKRAASKGAD